MTFESLLYSLGAPSFFSSRAFVPAFLTAFSLRYGEYIPFIGNLEILQASGAEPTWFTSNLTILALGGLAAGEMLATKMPEAEELLGELHKYGKTGMAALTSLGVMSISDAEFVNETLQQASLVGTVLASVSGVLAFIATSFRNAIFSVLVEIDPEDDLRIRGLLSWLEDLWGGAGVLLLLLYPVIMAAVGLAVIGVLYLIRKYLAYREEKTKRSCGECGRPMYASALQCPHCGARNPNPQAVGFLGQTTKQPAPAPELHALRLLSKRRCPQCASRLPERHPRQTCQACGYKVFSDPELSSRYLSMISGRLPKALGLSALFSLVPVVGLIPGMIYYRLALVSPFRTYIPAGQGFLLRWLVRILFLFLIGLQAIPGIGILGVPIMALINFTVYRSAFAAKLGCGESNP